MQRYFIYLAYNGTDYHGWQIQPKDASVQETIEKVMSMILRTPISIVGAGRTDSGVHATRMIAHFDLENPLENCAAFADKLNRVLPRDISIEKIVPVREDAHARFSALSRTYKYYVTTKKDPFRNQFQYRGFGKYDMDLMNKGAEILFDYIDFTSFSKLHTDVKTNNCVIMHARWEMSDDHEMVFTIKADRFLRNMVRAIVGTLLQIGNGKLTLDGFRQIIELKNRCKAGDSAVAHALFLVDVEYPEELFILE